MRYFRTLLTVLLLSVGGACFAQEDPSSNVLDDLQTDVKTVKVDAKKDSLSIELFLISYQMNPREFKLNTFATQVVDEKGASHLYSSMKMGRVTVNIADRQNYLHYLLEENVPVPLTIKIGAWKKGSVPKTVKLVFEDSAEEGKFITKEIAL